MTNTALLNRNNALSVDSRQRTKELQDESALLIAESRARRLRTGEVINQLQLAREDCIRIRIFHFDGKAKLSELYCQQFERSEAAARVKSNLFDGYPGVE